MQHHDIIVIGASAGGIDVLLDLVPELPKDLAASIFVSIHMAAGHISVLPELMTKRGHLRAKHPVHEERIERGMIYVAPPDNHLQLRTGFIDVVRGPKENGHRPSADVLFRSASSHYGPRVMGVVLSGYQNCGTAGLMSIKARGGVSVVQDPASAFAPDMPASAIANAPVDHVVHPAELPSLIKRLVNTPPGPTHEPNDVVRQLEGTERGTPADLVCPICEGVLTETQPGVFQHFRCHVGHAFSLESLVHEQSDELERVLWAAVRALEETATLARRLSASETGELKRRFAEKAVTHTQQADYIRQLLLHSTGGLAPEDGRRK